MGALSKGGHGGAGSGSPRGAESCPTGAGARSKVGPHVVRAPPAAATVGGGLGVEREREARGDRQTRLGRDDPDARGQGVCGLRCTGQLGQEGDIEGERQSCLQEHAARATGLAEAQHLCSPTMTS